MAQIIDVMEQIVGVERTKLDKVLAAGDDGVHASAVAAVSLGMVGLLGFDVVRVVEETVLTILFSETFLEDRTTEPEAEVCLGVLSWSGRSSCEGY